MATPNHPHNHRICRSTSLCCCNCNCCCGSGSLHPPSQPPETDLLLLQALAARLIHIQPPQTQTPVSDLLGSQHFSNYRSLEKNRFQQQHQSKCHFAVDDLLHRIDVLESSIIHFHSLSPSFHYKPSSSLRDLAARTIQTHFRRFLVHRSITLRNLKQLAVIRSSVNALKSCAEQNSEVLSYKAMDLLLKLESITGCDQIIREGKRSIHDELARYLDSVNHSLVVNINFAAKNNKKYGGFMGKLLRKTTSDCPQYYRVCENNVEDVVIKGSDYEEHSNAFICNGSHDFAKSKNELLMRRSGLQRKKKKIATRFAENGNLGRASKDFSDPIADIVSLQNRLELLENLCINGTHGIAKPINGVSLGDSRLQPKIKKTMRPEENENHGKLSRVPKDHNLPISDSDRAELVENIYRELEGTADRFSRGMEKKDGENERTEIEESSPNDRLVRKMGQENIRFSSVCEQEDDIEGICYEENPNVFIGNENPYSNMFSAPLPLKMESKDEMLSKKA